MFKLELVLWLSWVDDSLIIGLLQVVKDGGKKLGKEIEIEDFGKLNKFVGCKIELYKSERKVKFTQPVMIQSFFDKFSAGKKK